MEAQKEVLVKNNVLRLLILFLFLGSFLFLGKNSFGKENHSFKTPTTSYQIPDKVYKVLPSGKNKCYLGIFMATCWVNYDWQDYKGSWHSRGFTGNFNVLDGSTQEIDDFKSKTKKRPAIVHRSTYWDKDPWQPINDRPFTKPLHGNFDPRSREVVWCVAWTPPVFSAGYSTYQIADWLEKALQGTQDLVIVKAAKDAIAYKKPLMIELAVEVNSGNPEVHNKIPSEAYKKFHCYVVNIFRREFKKDKAPENVTWCLYGGHTSDYESLKEYYPGDSYIDWIGKSIYQGRAVHNLTAFGKPVYAPEYLPINSGQDNATADKYLKNDLDQTNFQAICLNTFDWTMAGYLPGGNIYHYESQEGYVSQHKDYLELSKNEYDYLDRYLVNNLKFLDKCLVTGK